MAIGWWLLSPTVLHLVLGYLSAKNCTGVNSSHSNSNAPVLLACWDGLGDWGITQGWLCIKNYFKRDNKNNHIALLGTFVIILILIHLSYNLTINRDHRNLSICAAITIIIWTLVSCAPHLKMSPMCFTAVQHYSLLLNRPTMLYLHATEWVTVA